jgi:hypothetical protein
MELGTLRRSFRVLCVTCSMNKKPIRTTKPTATVNGQLDYYGGGRSVIIRELDEARCPLRSIKRMIPAGAGSVPTAALLVR